MALKGNLRDFSTTQLFNLVNLARKTGTLAIHGTEEAKVSFQAGKLVYACLGDGHENGLPAVLFEKGKLSQEHYDIITGHIHNANEKQLGRLLIQAGYVSQTDILQSVRQTFLDIVYRLFTWTEGTFRFEAGEQPPPGRLTVPIDLESVIMEGSRRMQEWERLQEELPDLDASLQFTDRPDARLRNIRLTVEEWRVVAFVSPRNTIRQIARGNNLSDFQIRRIVYGLMQAGIVRLVPQAGSQPVQVLAGGQQIGTQQRADVRQASPTVKRSIVARLIERIKRL